MTADAELLAQWALWAGQRALPLFLAILARLLAATCACWWTLRRPTVPRRQGTISPTLSAGLRIEVGMAVILIGTEVFAGIASGATWLALCIMSIELMRWNRRRTV